MFMGNATLQPPGGGLDVQPYRVLVRKRGGDGSRGDLVAFDIPNADVAVGSNSIGKENSGLQNVLAPTAADGQYGQLAVLTEAISDDDQGMAVYSGEVKAYVQKGTGDIAAGDPLYVNTAGYLDADGVAGQKVVARSAVAVTAPATKTLARVLFSGINSLGTKHS